LLNTKIDPEPFLKKVGLTRRMIANPALRIPVNSQIVFLDLAAQALDDELLGFQLARVADLRETGLLYYVLASSDNLLDALRRAARYSTIVNEGLDQRLVDGKQVGVTMRYRGVSRHQDRHQAEIWITVIVRFCRQLTGIRLVPSRVRLAHCRAAKNREFVKFLGIKPEYGAAADEVLFHNQARSLSLIVADPYLNKLLIGYAESALKRVPRERYSFRAMVENFIIPSLPHGGVRADVVATNLGMSQRTFARRLSAEGSNFSQVMERLRSELAQRYLTDKQLTISEIAWLLGYRDLAAFSHAFKRWNGKNPSQMRVGQQPSSAKNRN
jgi:AraC-like DNA-binding protein